LANIESKLKEVINANKKANTLVRGLEPKEADELVDWIANSGKNNLFKKHEKESNLSGSCGLGQGINGFTITGLGLALNAYNAFEVFDSGRRHAFCTA
jgi:hypothetical protein